MAISSSMFKPTLSTTVTTTTVIVFNQVLALASGSTVNLATYTVPIGKVSYLEKISVSGSNIAHYTVFVNLVQIESAYTFFGSSLNNDFDFVSQIGGYKLSSGDILTVKVTHSRPFVGDFSSRIQSTEM